jgi:hypothetical protein
VRFPHFQKPQFRSMNIRCLSLDESSDDIGGARELVLVERVVFDSSAIPNESHVFSYHIVVSFFLLSFSFSYGIQNFDLQGNLQPNGVGFNEHSTTSIDRDLGVRWVINVVVSCPEPCVLKVHPSCGARDMDRHVCGFTVS